jgi:hypothetical protein
VPSYAAHAAAEKRVLSTPRATHIVAAVATRVCGAGFIGTITTHHFVASVALEQFAITMLCGARPAHRACARLAKQKERMLIVVHVVAAHVDIESNVCKRFITL